MSLYPTVPIDGDRVTDALAQVIYRDARHTVTAGDVVGCMVDAGYEVYATGGAPRDWLSGRDARDLDLYINHDLEAVHQLLLETFEGIDPVDRPRPGGSLLRWGDPRYGEVDISYLRSYRDIQDQDMWTTHFPLRHDLVEDALLHDFSVNSFYYDFRRHRLLDPLACGLGDIENSILRLVAHPTVLASSFRTALRIGLFLCRGYTASDNVQEYLDQHADRDIQRMGRRLWKWAPKNLTDRGLDVDEFQQYLEPWLRADESRRLLGQALADAAAAAD